MERIQEVERYVQSSNTNFRIIDFKKQGLKKTLGKLEPNYIERRVLRCQIQHISPSHMEILYILEEPLPQDVIDYT